MTTQEYCGRHSIHYTGDSCPRCDAEERHKELLRVAEESAAETVDAMRESDYRRANPGDYQCPHCKYISLRRTAHRCPLCRGDIGSDYWDQIRATEEATAEKERTIKAAVAAEWIRTAPAREAAAKAAALAAARDAESKRQTEQLKSIGGLVIGVTIGAVASGLVGFVVGMIASIPIRIGCAIFAGPSTNCDASTETWAEWILYLIVVLGAILGATLGWRRPWRD